MKLYLNNLTRQNDALGNALYYKLEFVVFDAQDSSKRTTYQTDPSETILVTQNIDNIIPILEREAGSTLTTLAVDKVTALPTPIKLEKDLQRLNATYFPAPTCTITANKSIVKENDSVTITWSSTNAYKCDGNFPISGTEGTTDIVIIEPREFFITCYGDGKAEARTKVTTYPRPTVNLTSDQPITEDGVIIEKGTSVTLSWSTENANSVVADFSVQTGTNGFEIVSPIITTTYTITAIGDGGEITTTLTITVV